MLAAPLEHSTHLDTSTDKCVSVLTSVWACCALLLEWTHSLPAHAYRGYCMSNQLLRLAHNARWGGEDL